MNPDQELRYLQEARQSLVTRLEAARAATWGSVPDWGSYPGSSEVGVAGAEEMRRQAEWATSRTVPPHESVELLEKKLVTCDLYIEDAWRRAQEIAALERSEEPGLEELVGNSGDLVEELGEYKKDLTELQKTVGVTDKTMEHIHADAPAADPIAGGLLALGVMADMANRTYEAWTGKEQAEQAAASEPIQEVVARAEAGQEAIAQAQAEARAQADREAMAQAQAVAQEIMERAQAAQEAAARARAAEEERDR